jgi:hypothetical protein
MNESVGCRPSKVLPMSEISADLADLRPRLTAEQIRPDRSTKTTATPKGSASRSREN